MVFWNAQSGHYIMRGRELTWPWGKIISLYRCLSHMQINDCIQCIRYQANLL